MSKKRLTIEEIFTVLRGDDTVNSFVVNRMIKIILGSSVIRVFSKGTKPALMKGLKAIPVNELNQLTTQTEFDSWHQSHVRKIQRILERSDKDRARFEKGELFGHATKVVNLYLGHLVLYSHYFKKVTINRVKYLLHVPLDSKVFIALRGEPSLIVPGSIKELKSGSYDKIQKAIREHALNAGLPAIYFDEYAWAYDKDL